MPNPFQQFRGQMQQKAAPVGTTDTSTPTFSGLSTATPNSDASVTLAWSAGSTTKPILEYRIYIAVGSVSAAALFVSGNYLFSVLGLTARVNTLSDFVTFFNPGSTYTFGVRAEDAFGYTDSNTVVVTATISSVGYNTLAGAVWDQAKSSHTIAGSFGTYLDAQVSLAQTASTALTQYNALTTAIGTLQTSATALSQYNSLTTAIGLVQQASTALTQYGNILSAIGSPQQAGTALTQYNNLTVAIGLLQTAATALSQFNTLVSDITAIPTNPLLTTDSRLNNLDTTISSRAPASTALSTAQWTNTRATLIDFLDAAISSRLAAASYTAPDNADIASIKLKTDNLPSDPASNTQVNTRLSSSDVRLNDLDAAISSRAPASTALSTAQWTNTRAGFLDFLDAAISSRASASTALSTAQWTNARALLLDYLDTTVSSRQSSAASTSQYNALIAALSSIQNNTNFSGIVPQIMDIPTPSEGSETYTFYANTLNSSAQPVDPDGNILNFTVKDAQGDILQAQTAMTRDAVGAYHGTFTVTSSMTDVDVVVFFNYSISSQNFEQIRTSKITNSANDSANIAAIKSKTDLLPADPASNTYLTTRASQSSVNLIPTNPLLTTDARLNDLDASISSRAPAATALSTAEWTNVRAALLDYLDATISSRLSATDSRVNFLDVAVSSRSTGTDVGTLLSRLTATRAGLLDNLPNLDVTVSSIAGRVWEELLSNHTNAGTFGKEIQGITPSQVATSVWNALLSDNNTVGTFGFAVNQTAQIAPPGLIAFISPTSDLLGIIQYVASTGSV